MSELIEYRGRLVHRHWISTERDYLPVTIPAWPMTNGILERCRRNRPDWDWPEKPAWKWRAK